MACAKHALAKSVSRRHPRAQHRAAAAPYAERPPQLHAPTTSTVWPLEHNCYALRSRPFPTPRRTYCASVALSVPPPPPLSLCWLCAFAARDSSSSLSSSVQTMRRRRRPVAPMWMAAAVAMCSEIVQSICAVSAEPLAPAVRFAPERASARHNTWTDCTNQRCRRSID